MGAINLWAVIAATAAFWLVGGVWYTLLGGVLRRAGRAPAAAFGAVHLLLAFAFEMLVVLTLAHLVARTDPPNFVVMMMAAGFALTIMTPAVGIVCLAERKPLAMFLIDAGHFLAGMLAAGGVLVLLR